MAVFQKIIHRPLHGKRLVRGDIGRVHIHRTADHNHGDFLVLDLPHKIRVLIALGQHDDPVKIRRVYEVSVLSFCDGKTVKPMVSSMDHKRALDGDQGLNTGGMGTVAPNPYYTQEVADRCMKEIFLPTVAAMQAEGCPFKGCLYFGLMLTPDGPKVIEYNCRFGDPETQVVLPLLESDLLIVMQATTNGTLADTEVKFRDGAAACVILASGGYPLSYEKGKEITGLTEGQLPDCAGVTVYHAGTALKDGVLVTSGGRVLGVTATADTLAEALKSAYAASENIHFDKLHKRSDIGARALAAMQ